MKIKKLAQRAMFGGLLVLLPLAIVLGFFYWVFTTVAYVLSPLTGLLLRNFGMPELVGHFLVILLIALVCLATGTIVMTKIGQWLQEFFDGYLVKLPGYKIVRELVNQLLGNSDSPFAGATVAKAQLFGASVATSTTVLVTSRHEDGSFSVFVPTSPNPTSGFVYHLPEEQVTLFPDISVDHAFRTIIACGAGSNKLFQKAELVDAADTKES